MLEWNPAAMPTLRSFFHEKSLAFGASQRQPLRASRYSTRTRFVRRRFRKGPAAFHCRRRIKWPFSSPSMALGIEMFQGRDEPECGSNLVARKSGWRQQGGSLFSIPEETSKDRASCHNAKTSRDPRVVGREQACCHADCETVGLARHSNL